MIDISKNINDINMFSAIPPPSYRAMKNISINNAIDTIPNVRFAKGIPSCLNDTIHFNNIKPKLINSRNKTSLFHKRSATLFEEVKFGLYARSEHHNARIMYATVKSEAFTFGDINNRLNVSDIVYALELETNGDGVDTV